MTKGAAVVGATGVKLLAAAVERALKSGSQESSLEADFVSPEVSGALAELAESVALVNAHDRGDGVLFVPEHRTAALLMSFLASRATDPSSAASEEVFEAQLAKNDLQGWALEFALGWLKGRFYKQSFVMPNRETSRVGNQFRMAVLGDWGSGLYGAPFSASSIQVAKPAFDRLLHLGDVYYAGTKQEVIERFLNLWPDVPGATSWALNSNHEMYSGGEGYFGTTLVDPRFSGQKRSSCFAWENDHFIFLGLDTGYIEHDISANQRSWISDITEQSDKKLVLFSHHQPFSAFEEGGDKLLAALADVLDSRRVAAWYWGHEHRCVFFERHPRWGLWGRCVGNGGYPEKRDSFDDSPESTNSDGSSWRSVVRSGVPDAWVLDGPNPYVPGHAHEYGANGYVALHFDGPVIHEAVHAPDGSLLLAHDAS